MALSLHDIGQTEKAREMLKRCERELKADDLGKAVKDSRHQALLRTRKLINDSASSKKN